MDIISLSNDLRAQLALLVMYAWDMCDKDPNPDSIAVDPRIAQDGWRVVGIITGCDDVLASGPNGIRQQQVRVSGEGDRRRYGYVAQNGTGDYVIAIRGTDGAEEWFDDCVFVAKQQPGLPGRVESGFSDIYESMRYFPLSDPTNILKLSDGIKAQVGGSPVTVLGHSLGSSLATYLTYDLADKACLGTEQLGALLFASPKTGDHDFVSAFANRVSNYLVVNYEHDIVPRVPPFDIMQLDLYRTLPNCLIITDESGCATIKSDKKCCHHLICYVALLSPTIYAKSSADWLADDKNCASCVIDPPSS